MPSTQDKTSFCFYAKAASGKVYDLLSAILGSTNAFVANLFTLQAQLSLRAAVLLRNAVPGTSAADLITMQKCPVCPSF
jgi:cyanate lyase